MARPSNRSGQRDLTNQLTRSLDDDLLDALTPVEDFPSPSLMEISDARLWHPEPSSRPSNIDGRPATRIVLAEQAATPVWSGTPGSAYRFNMPRLSLAFEHPSEVVHCVRRKVRRQVIFAKGRNGRTRRPRRRQWHSRYRC